MKTLNIITNEKTALLQTLLKKYDEVGEFIGGIAIVMRDGLYGLVDDQGKEIYAPKCSNIWRWPNNFFKFVKVLPIYLKFHFSIVYSFYIIYVYLVSDKDI